ncbi:MAG: hypothetical protein HY275_00400 [Gemmatimonadetes bacterium]|nr:hypothetical protein [Gemmatimonadota bacterium]
MALFGVLSGAPLVAQDSGLKRAAGEPDAEPRAEISATALGDPQITVRTPSYLALFEVIPFTGVAQLWPLSTAQGHEVVKEGLMTLGSAQTAMARRLSARGVAMVSAGPGPAVPGQGRRAFPRPHRYVLLASDQPIRVDAPNVTLAMLASRITGIRSPAVFAGEQGDIDAIVALVRSPGANTTVDVASVLVEASHRTSDRAVTVAITPGAASAARRDALSREGALVAAGR